MKAKLKNIPDSKPREVVEIYKGYYKDKEGTIFAYSELEFLPEPAPEKAVIEGWVAIDEAGMGEAYLHTEKPHAKSGEFCDTGDYEIRWESDGKCYLLDHELFPNMDCESEPQRVKIEITPIDE